MKTGDSLFQIIFANYYWHSRFSSLLNISKQKTNLRDDPNLSLKRTKERFTFTCMFKDIHQLLINYHNILTNFISSWQWVEVNVIHFTEHTGVRFYNRRGTPKKRDEKMSTENEYLRFSFLVILL
jgi:hypothetical protein